MNGAAVTAQTVITDMLAGVAATAISAVPNLRHVEYFHDHHRIERLFFDGALGPAGPALRDPTRTVRATA